MTAVDGMDDEIKALVQNYKNARAKLAQWNLEQYPNDTVVYVEGNSYTGFGVVDREPNCPTEMVSVKLEHQENRWYPIQAVCLANRPGNWPAWIQRLKKIKTPSFDPEKK